jgi:choline dehydrogenase-like flavoprotein
MANNANEPVRFRTTDEVDFVIIGSGAAGGVLAKELSEAGFNIVVLEQGPHWRPSDFRHDEWAYLFNNELTWGTEHGHPQTFRKTVDEEAVIWDEWGPCSYAHVVGGSHAHFSGNYWRLRPNDFRERTLLGPIAGTSFADWPISYDDLEPYYTKVDWEVGVSGVEGPSDPPRSRGYPCPPMPVKSPGVLLERAGKKLGLHPYPAPVAILSKPHNGRPACIHCGFCNGAACEVGAKGSSHIAMIPLAEATGRCEIRALSTVFRIETNEAGRATRVHYFDRDGNEQAQRAKAVIVSANGSETPRLLLLSESSQFPNGLANSSGMVGKNLMFNGWTWAVGLFDHPVNAQKSIPTTRVIHDFYESDPSRGFYGGGGIDSRSASDGYPLTSVGWAARPGAPNWGAEFKRTVNQYFTHTAAFTGHSTSLPLESNSVSLDPNVRDKWGRPALRTTYKDHPDDIKTMQFFVDKSVELLEAAGAKETWHFDAAEQTASSHLLGTCRMGDDPKRSVVDKHNRAHDVANLFICDGSSLVTSGRGQPTMTIQALAFRAADYIAEAAKKGDI